VIYFFNKNSGLDLTTIFNQYLRYNSIPDLLVRLNNNKLEFKWNVNEPNFNMPYDININGKETRIYPTTDWTTSKIRVNKSDEVEAPTNKFYINVHIEK
jgi:hypothetical protein